MNGYKTWGHGPEKVLVLHDWFSDCASYDFMLPLLDVGAFTYCFMDLRGYGRSLNLQGECTVEEITRDVLTLADHLKWPRFHLVGHSMTGLVAQWMAIYHKDRLKSAVAITPVPASGALVPEDVMVFLEDAARDNDESADAIVGMMTGQRLSPGFREFKVSHWRHCSKPEARVAYLHMFCETNFATQAQGCDTPLLVVAGEFDAPSAQQDVLTGTILTWYSRAQVQVCPNSGHYPQQEAPAYLTQMIETFLHAHA